MLKVESTEYLAQIHSDWLEVVNEEWGVYYSHRDCEVIVMNVNGETVTVIQK